MILDKDHPGESMVIVFLTYNDKKWDLI